MKKNFKFVDGFNTSFDENELIPLDVSFVRTRIPEGGDIACLSQKTALYTETKGSFSGYALGLNPDFNWSIGYDDNNTLMLLPTQKIDRPPILPIHR